MLKNEKAKSELELDIKEMTAMLDSYVSFVKTESPEPIETIIINELIADIIKTVEKNNIKLILNEKLNFVKIASVLTIFLGVILLKFF